MPVRIRNFVSGVAIILALGTLIGCEDQDVRERTYLEVACPGILVEDGGKYKCVEGAALTLPIDMSDLIYQRTVTVNRRTGTVAFDGRLVGECRVANFDAWECVDRSTPSSTAMYDIVWFRSGRGEGGYVEDWCNVKPGAPSAHTSENCHDQRYYGIPMSEITRIRFFLRDQFCSARSFPLCKLL